jgi:hypothetical protein
MKLKTILQEMGSFPEGQRPKKLSKDELKLALEAIGSYNSHGKHLKRGVGLQEISKRIKEAVELASKVALENLNENDWFNSKVVERNMNEARKHADEFEKVACEVHQAEMQLEALYDEIGHKIARYYEIKDETPSQDGLTITK